MSPLVLVGFCIWWWCMVFRERVLHLRNSGSLMHCLMLSAVSLLWLLLVSLASLLEILTLSTLRYLCLAKGIFAGLWFDLQASWARTVDVAPAATCKHSFSST